MRPQVAGPREFTFTHTTLVALLTEVLPLMQRHNEFDSCLVIAKIALVRCLRVHRLHVEQHGSFRRANLGANVAFERVLLNVVRFTQVHFDLVVVPEGRTAQRAVINPNLAVYLLLVSVELMESVEHLPAVLAAEADVAALEMPLHPNLVFEGASAYLTNERVRYMLLVHVRHHAVDIVELILAQNARVDVLR